MLQVLHTGRFYVYSGRVSQESEVEFDDHAATHYLNELIQQAETGILAAHGIHSALDLGKPNDEIFSNARTMANAAAMISKILWPGELRRHKDEEKPSFARRKALAGLRGPELRRMLSIPDVSPLENKGVRNAIEHFDERLDRRLSSPDRNIWTRNVGPRGAYKMPGTSEPFLLEHYDDHSGEYIILNDSLIVPEVAQAMEDLLAMAKQQKIQIDERRFGPRRA